MGDFVRESGRNVVKSEESGTESASTLPDPDHSQAAKDSEDMATQKRTTAPAFQFYPKDFLTSSKVMLMTMAERGMYITLLAICWLDGSLPADVSALAKMVSTPTKHFAALWPKHLQGCFLERDGRLTNERLNIERKRQADYRKRQVDNGKKGGRPFGKGLGKPNETQAFVKKKPTESPRVADEEEDGDADRTSSMLSKNKKEDAPPLDAWWLELQRDYPQNRVTSGHLTEIAFMRLFEQDARPALEVWREFCDNLANNIRSHEWRVKGMVPRLQKYLEDGGWRQRHDEFPPTTGTTPRTSGNVAALQRFVDRGSK